MYKRITATGDPAIAIANFVFKRPADDKSSHGYPRWVNPTRLECMQLASYSKLEKIKKREERWEVEKNSSFYMLISRSSTAVVQGICNAKVGSSSLSSGTIKKVQKNIYILGV